MTAGQGVAGRFVRNRLAMVGMVALVVIVAMSLAAPLIARHPPSQSSLRDAFGGPSWDHFLGLDSAGRDIWSRLWYGGRNTMSGAVVALAVATVIGVPAGLVAGYFGGRVDSVANWMANLLMALPAMIVLLSGRAILGPTVTGLMIVLGFLAAPSYFRLVRNIVANVRNEAYVDAARVAGLRPRRIITRHVLTVVRAPIIIQTALVAGVALGLQAGLEYLGVGSGGGQPTWGAMLNEGFGKINSHPILIVWPGLALGLTTACLVLVATGLRDALEDRGTQPVRRRGRHVAVAPADLDGKPARAALLSVRSLAVSYVLADGTEREVVHDVDLDVGAGQIVGLVGESGSGKSQTAYSILGILPEGGRVSRGSVTIGGTEVVGRPERELRRLRAGSVAYVPQEPLSNLDPSFTVGSQLVEPLRVTRGMSKRAATARAIELLRLVEIAEPERVFAQYPHEISGGMAQRVLIAGAMSSEPRLLIADEPTTALDVTVQAEVLALLRRLQSERGLGVLLVTHNLGVVADLCDAVAVMQDGRIVETGPAEDILSAPREDYTRRLVAAVLDEPVPAGAAGVAGVPA